MILTMLRLLALSAEGELSYHQYIDRAREVFSQSPQARQLERSAVAFRTQQQATMLQSPLTLGAGLGATAYQTPTLQPGELATRQAFGSDLQASVAFRERSSFETTLTARTGLAALQQPSAIGTTSVPYSAEVRVSYDLIQGGSDSSGWLAARSSKLRIGQQEIQLRLTRVQRLLDLLGLATAAANTQCQLAILTEVEPRIAETVKSGEIELKARTLSQKDFLNFTSLDQNFRAQKAGLMSALAVTKRALEAYGDAGQALLADLPRVRCKVIAPVLPADWGTITVAETVAQAQPGVRSIEVLREALALDISAARLANQASLAPFLSGAFAGSSPASRPLAQGTVGLSFQWNVPMQRGALNLRATEEQADALAEVLTQTYGETRSQLLRNFEQVRAQANVVTALLAAETNANKLLAVIAAQKAIGQVDSLNFTSAYLSRVQASLSALDAWASLNNAFNDIRERALLAGAPLPDSWTQPFTGARTP